MSIHWCYFFLCHLDYCKQWDTLSLVVRVIRHLGVEMHVCFQTSFKAWACFKAFPSSCACWDSYVVTYSLFKLYKCVCSEVVLYFYQGRWSHSRTERVYDYVFGELFSVNRFRFSQIQAAGCECLVRLHFKVGLAYEASFCFFLVLGLMLFLVSPASEWSVVVDTN